MPSYDVNIPGKGTFTVDSPEELTDEQAYAAVLRQLRAESTPQEPESQPQTGFVPNVKASIERLKGDYYAGLASLGKEGAAEEAEKHRKKAAQLGTVPEITEHPVDYVTSLLGQSVPYMAAPLVAGASALLLPEATAAAPVLGGLTTAGRLLGMGAAGATSATQFYGTHLSRQLEEGTRPEDLNVGAAAAAAVPAAALDIVGLRFIPGIRNIFGRAGIKIGDKEAAGLVNKYIVPALKASGVEGGVEAGQAFLERLQAGLSISDEKAKKEYFDNFLGGAVLGGVLSVPGSFMEGSGKAPTTEKPATEPEAPQTEAVPEPQPITEAAAVPQLPAPEALPQLGYTPPIKALPAPEEKPDVYKLMEQHDTLKNSLDPLAAEIEAARQAGDAEKARDLMRQYRENETALNTLNGKITELGGFTQTREEVESEHTKTLKGIDAKITKLENTILENSRADVRDYDVVEKAEKQVEKLKAERARAEEEFQRKQGLLRVKETPKGEQIPLFGAEEAQPVSTEPLKFKTEKGEELTAAELEKKKEVGPVHPAVAEEAAADRLRDQIDDIERIKATRALTEKESLQLEQLREALDVKQQQVNRLKTDKATLAKIDAKKAEADDLLKQIVAMSSRVTSENKEVGGPKLATDEQRQAIMDELNALRAKYREAQEREGAMSDTTAQPGAYDAIDAQKESARRRIAQLERDLAKTSTANIKRNFINEYNKKTTRLNQLYAEIDNLHNEPVEQTTQPVDLFDYGNQIRTATLNKDHATLMKLLKQLKSEGKIAPEGALERARKKAQEKEGTQSERDKLLQTLGKRMGYKTTVSERTVTEEEYDQIAKRITELMDSIDKPKGRAKESIKDKVDRLSREIDGLTENVNNSELPARTRQGARKSLNAKIKEYNHLVENVMVPARDEIYALYRSMYTVREEDRTGAAVKHLQDTAEKTRKEKVDEFKSRVEDYGPDSPQVREFVEKNLEVKMSAEYKRFKKDIEGKTATSSPKKVAMELGQTTDEYKKFAAPKEKEIAKRKAAYEKYEADAKAELARLKAEVGETSPDYKNRVAEYTKTAKEKLDAWKNAEKALGKALETKAVELGKAHPDYRKKKLEATKKFKETVAKVGGATQASRRTTQEMRKLPKLKNMQTASEESRAKSRAIAEKREPGLLPSQAGEKPEVPFKPKAEKSSASAMMGAFQAAAAKRLKETGKLMQGSEVESKDLTEEQVNDLENNNVLGALNSIIEDDTNSPVNRAVAVALEAFLDATNVTVHDKLYAPQGQEVLGMATSKQIDISRIGLSQEVLLHEGVHAAAERVIAMAKEDITQLSKEQQAAYRELERLFEAVKNDPTFTSFNAKSDISEFAAEALSNENLQNQLRGKKWKVGNAFKSFVSYILKMIGVNNVDTMLDASIAAVEALMIPTSVGQRVATEEAKALPKDVGVTEDKPGMFSFKSHVEKSTPSSIVASDTSNIDNLKANFLGLRGRVQLVDKFAAISEAFKKGMTEGKINALEAGNAEYFMRFGENRSQYAQQALTNGPIKRTVSRETKEGKEYVYRSEAGANLMRVFEKLQKAGIKNSTELDRMFTVYQAGKRAQQVGWEKLWVGDPKKAKAEYEQVAAMLKADPKMQSAFDEASKEYKAFNRGLLDFLVETGAMSKEQADKLASIDYVPYYRINKGSGDVEMFTDKEHPVRIGNIKDEPQLQSLVGDNTQILPLSVSAVQNAFMLTDMGLRNQRVKDTCFTLHKIGFAKTLGEGVGPTGRDTVRFKVHGKPYYAIIDTDLYGIPADLIVKGMEGIKTTMPFAVEMMGVPADLLRKFVTRNPAYAIKQAIRDPMTAWMTNSVSGVPVLNSFKELSSMVAGRSDVERKLMEAGAISSNVFTGGKEDMQKFLRDISAGKSGWEKLLAKADAFALQGDAATRAVIYRDSLAKGMSEQQALLRTLESMNFGRRGLSPTLHFLNTMIPFFNAQIQGLDVLYRAFTKQMPFEEQLKIREKLMARGLMLAAGTLAYAAMMQDDEAYKRAKPEERLGNWFVYIPGSDEPLRVPIPFELGYLFKSLPEAVFNMAAEDERSSDITKGMGKLVMLSQPIGLPQAVKPLVELRLGKSFFGGDIESAREQREQMPTERARASTTEAAKLLGSLTGDAGITPIGWDHLFRGYTGGLGIALISLANPLLNTEASDVEKPSKKMHETPFVGGLFQPVEGRGTLDAAYERMLEIQQAKGTYDRLVQSGKREEAKQFLDEYRSKITSASVSGAVQQQLGQLATMKRRVMDMPNLSQEKKDEILERLDKQQVTLARRFLSITGETRPQ